MTRLPQPPAQPMWTCDCGTANEAWRSICRNCQTAAEQDATQPALTAAAAQARSAWWICGCTTPNDPDFHPRVCRSCGTERPASAQREADIARAADIAAVVAEAPPLTAQQLVMLRRIFARPVAPARKKAA